MLVVSLTSTATVFRPALPCACQSCSVFNRSQSIKQTWGSGAAGEVSQLQGNLWPLSKPLISNWRPLAQRCSLYRGATGRVPPCSKSRLSAVYAVFGGGPEGSLRGRAGPAQRPLHVPRGGGRPYPDDVTVLTRPVLAQFLLLGACLSPSLPTGGFKVSPRVILKLIEAGWNNIYSIIKLLCTHAKSLQSCPTLCKPMDYSPPGSSVHGILQARKLEWVAMPSSRRSSWLRDRTWVSYVFCIGSLFLCH